MASVNAPRHLDRALRHALAQTSIRPEDVTVVVNGPAVISVAKAYEREGVHVAYPGWNLGTCRAWNYICRRAFESDYDAVLIINDDLELVDPETITKLQARFSDPLGLRQFIYLSEQGYSAACISRPVWDESGPFDENIWPAYYCDNESHYRIGMAGFPTDHLIVETKHDRSASLRQDQGLADAMTVAFQMNHEYFVKKWGGEPKQEKFTVPFNGGPPVAGTLERLPIAIRRILECRYA